MAFTVNKKAFCVLEFAKTESIVTVHRQPLCWNSCTIHELFCQSDIFQTLAVSSVRILFYVLLHSNWDIYGCIEINSSALNHISKELLNCFVIFVIIENISDCVE